MEEHVPEPSPELRAQARKLTAARTGILGRLGALRALHADELPAYERELVIAGRLQGITWEALAEALGRVRQNLHRQYSSAVAARQRELEA